MAILDDVNELLRQGIGNRDRLVHIKESLEAGRPLFNSDQNYVVSLATKHLQVDDEMIPGHAKNDPVKKSGKGGKAAIIVGFAFLLVVAAGAGLYALNSQSSYSQLLGEYYVAVDERNSLESENYLLGSDKQRLKSQVAVLDSDKQHLESQIVSLQEKIEELNRDVIEEYADTNPVIRGLIDGEITYYVEPLPNYSTYDISNFDEHLDGRHWEGVPLTRVYDKNQADFSIRWVKDYGPETLGVAYSKTTATVGLGSSKCYGEWQHFDDWTITKVAWHEIGHILGFGHSDDPNNIMWPTEYTRYKHDRDFKKTIPANWWNSFNFCNNDSQYFYFETSKESDAFEIFVLTPDTDVKEFINNNEGRYYPACGELGERWHKKGSDCQIPDGAKLVIKNVEDYPIKIEGYMENKNKHPDIDLSWDQDAYAYPPEFLDRVNALFR